VNPDGTFAAQVTPGASGSYRATAANEHSPAVDLLVLDRTVSTRVADRRLSVTVSPHSPGATVVLQLYLKDRFGWWPVAARRLDKRSHASFSLRYSRPVSARVVLTLPDRATAIATSEMVRIRTRKLTHLGRLRT
jgi:hypothetical protein